MEPRRYVWRRRCKLCGELLINGNGSLLGSRCRSSRREYRIDYAERSATTDLDRAWDLIFKVFSYLIDYKIDCDGNFARACEVAYKITDVGKGLDYSDSKASMAAAMDSVMSLYHIVAQSPRQCSRDLRIYTMLSECFKVLGMDKRAKHVEQVNRNQAIYILMGINKQVFRRKRYLKTMKKWVERYNKRRDALIREHHGYDKV